MGYDHYYFAFVRYNAQVFHKSRRHYAVKAGIRLVQEEKAWVRNELHRYVKPLFLPAAQLFNERIALPLKAQHFKHLIYARLTGVVCGIGGHFHLRCVVKGMIHGVIIAQKILLRPFS